MYSNAIEKEKKKKTTRECHELLVNYSVRETDNQQCFDHVV